MAGMEMTRERACGKMCAVNVAAETVIAIPEGNAQEVAGRRRRGSNGPGGRPRGAGGGDGGGDVGRDGSVRKLGTSNSSSTESCTRRSIAAAVAIWSRKIRSHWLKTRLLVTITERRS